MLDSQRQIDIVTHSSEDFTVKHQWEEERDSQRWRERERLGNEEYRYITKRVTPRVKLVRFCNEKVTRPIYLEVVFNLFLQQPSTDYSHHGEVPHCIKMAS